MKGRYILIIFLFLIMIVACQRKDDSEFTDTPIVEAYLRPGDYINMKVSRQLPFSSNVSYSTDNIDGLDITVECEGVTHTLKPAGDGKYIDSTLIVKQGETYNLSFNYNGKEVKALTDVPLKPVNFTESDDVIYVDRMDSTFVPGQGGMGSMPEPVTLRWTNNDESYYIVVIENLETTLDPIREFSDSTRPANMFRKAPTTAAGLQLRQQEFQYFGRHRIILYHVLPDYASLYDETTTSSLNLTNPSTSIRNGYGIFTGLNADTLYLKVKENK
jgi:hypothetical protein